MTNDEEITLKQNELRIKRNNLTEEYYKQNKIYQDEIDRLEMERYGALDFIGKYYKVTKPYTEIHYLHILGCKRLFSGPRFTADCVFFNDNGDCHFYKEDDVDGFTWLTFKTYLQEITKEEYNSKVNIFINNIKKSLE